MEILKGNKEIRAAIQKRTWQQIRAKGYTIVKAEILQDIENAFDTDVGRSSFRHILSFVGCITEEQNEGQWQHLTVDGDNSLNEYFPIPEEYKVTCFKLCLIIVTYQLKRIFKLAILA